MIEDESIQKVFTINNHLTLKLEDDGKTTIYVNGQEFIQCKHLLLSLSINKIGMLNEFQSIISLKVSTNKVLSSH